MSPLDRDWVAALRSDAIERDEVVANLRDFLYRSLARGFGNRFSDGDLDDLAQDSMLRIQQKLDTFAGRSKFTTWAASIAVRVALSELRRRKHEHLSLEQAIEAGQQALEPIAPAEAPGHLQRLDRDRILHDAIHAALSERQRTAILAELGGLPLEEIARRTKSSRGALYKLLHDARKRLRADFESRGLVAGDMLSDVETFL